MVQPASPYVVWAIPTLVIVNAAKRFELSWNIEQTLCSTLVKADRLGYGDKEPLDGEKSSPAGRFRESEEKEGVWKAARMSEGRSSS